MVQARKCGRRNAGTRPSEFRRKDVFAEKLSGERLDHFRLMVIRGEYDKIIWHVEEESEANIRYVARLLLDDGLGVAPNAADVLAELVSRGVDIKRAVPELHEALGNKYARANAARALALQYLTSGMVTELRALVGNDDPGIREPAQRAVSEGYH